VTIGDDNVPRDAAKREAELSLKAGRYLRGALYVIVLAQPPLSLYLSSRLKILPEGLLGTVSMKTTSRGIL